MKEKLLNFLDRNWIIIYNAITIILIELMAVLVTSSKFYISSPRILITLVLLISICLYIIKSQFVRYITSVCLMTLFAIVDIIFIVIYELTGQTFEFQMFSLRNDAFGIIESIPINTLYFFVIGIVISAFVIFGKRYLDNSKCKIIEHKRGILIKVCSILVSIVFLYLSVTSLSVTKDFYEELIYSTSDNSYSKSGVTSNFLTEMYKGLTKSDDYECDFDTLTSYLYDDSQIKKSNHKENFEKEYNVVTVLCESLEWMSFICDLEKYPNGLVLTDPTGNNRTQEELARDLFPNLYKVLDESTIMTNFHSKEKTDISENYSNLGVYPTNSYTNYDFYENTISLSLANTLKTLDTDIACNIFHNGTNSFYNRNIYEHTIGFDNYYAYDELQECEEFTDWYKEGQRNLDSQMVDCFKDEMFPTNKRFYTYIISITSHGQYTYRESLSNYYDKLNAYGIYVDPEKPFSDTQNAYYSYVGACMELDNMIGKIYDELQQRGLLENTVISLFGDHNCYYQGLSNYVKDIPDNYKEDGIDYTFLYNVPWIVRIPNSKAQVIDKFTCTSDILPTIYDILGIDVFGNFMYGNSAFNEEESILYSRAYNFFVGRDIIYTSLNNIKYQGQLVNIYDITNKTQKLVEKIKNIDLVFYNDYFSKELTDNLNNILSKASVNGISTYNDYYKYKIRSLNKVNL